ncbi:hypothetical protein LEP1GSC035_0369 [Leptospira noguchii str. 2007001578]|uniref:Lipoprotein n=1 Tax=Leptospira noguchii str. 2007001578 TaxID=1049974 RepID=A0ABN0J1G6_9LEPT|nr:hypothetical protein LEP1GSC035_0369 [Leptospira noguchii str. 2007001578]
MLSSLVVRRAAPPLYSSLLTLSIALRVFPPSLCSLLLVGSSSVLFESFLGSGCSSLLPLESLLLDSFLLGFVFVSVCCSESSCLKVCLCNLKKNFLYMSVLGSLLPLLSLPQFHCISFSKKRSRFLSLLQHNPFEWLGIRELGVRRGKTEDNRANSLARTALFASICNATFQSFRIF